MNQPLDTVQSAAGFGAGWLAWLNVASLALLITLAALALTLLLAPTSSPSRWLRSRAPSLSGRLLVSLLLVSCVPLVSLSLVLVQRDMQRMLDAISQRLQASASEVASKVSHTMDRNLRGIVSLASHISSRDDRERRSLELWLSAHHATNADLLTMLAADDEARVVAATHRSGGQVVPFGATIETIDDREYFTRPMSDGLPFVSDVFQGRGLGQDPIVAISAPLIDAGGRIWGIVEGSLDLRVFAGYLPDQRPDTETRFVLLDDRDRVIYASAGTGLGPLTELPDHPLLKSAPGTRTATYFFEQHSDDGSSERFLSSSATLNNGWQVFLYSPLAPLRGAVLKELWVTAAWLVFAAFVAVVLTVATTASTSRPLRQLESALQAAEIDESFEFPLPSEAAPREIQLVHRRIQHAVSGLRRKNRQLLQSLSEAEKLRVELGESLASRDRAIEEQTRELRQANMTLHLLNRTDSLTGLANRQGFKEFLSQVWTLAKREGQAVSVVCLDIDHFKAYNDHYGHPAGDRCLARVAAAANECAARPLDHMARTGGEEFVAILGDTGLAAAVLVAERMRRRVEELEIANEGAALRRVTVSVGVASTRPTGQDKAGGLVELGDQALYAAKNGGRNLVAYADHGRLHLHEPTPMKRESRTEPASSVLRESAGSGSNIIPMRSMD